MNCVPGDIARVTSDVNRDRLLTCESWQPTPVGPLWACTTLQTFTVRESIFHSKMVDVPPGSQIFFLDEYLRPIRDIDGQDEMVGIAGKPPAVELTEKAKTPEKVEA